MSELLEFVFAFCIGAIIGLFYFRGLWWTVSKCRTAGNPFAVYLLSLIVRTAVLLGCLFLLMQLGVVQMLIGLVGFYVVRVVVVRHFGFADDRGLREKATG